MMKGSIHWEDIAVLSEYAPNNRASEYVKPKLIELKGEIDKSTISFRDFNASLSKVNRKVDKL